MDAGVFQTVGAGAHYLAKGSPWQNAGAINVPQTVLADIAARTTYPPVILSNRVFSTPQTFSLQAPRNTGRPDLGYHYDPLDYLTDELTVTKTSLAISNGVAIACYNRPGITLQNGASLTSVGAPQQPNWFVRYQSVQEQPVSLGGKTNGLGQNIAAAGATGSLPSASFGFSHFATPAAGGTHFNATGASAFGNLTLRNCELWEGTNVFSGAQGSSTTLLINNLFYRTTLFASNAAPHSVLVLSNNLLSQSVVTLIQPLSSGTSGGSQSSLIQSGVSLVQPLNPVTTQAATVGTNASSVQSGPWFFFDNAVDNSVLATNSLINNGFNAFLNCPFALSGPGNIILTKDLAYQSGPLGGFYQPVDSPLINAGSTTADLAGFFHFTTQASELKETNSVLDIGYHYVAVDVNGNPEVSNDNGIPDYLADANGDGLVDDGEQPWLAPPVITLQPTNQILYPGSNLVFSAAVTGVELSLQWYCNSAPLPGATNLTLPLNDL
jgi:hypothetical protein